MNPSTIPVSQKIPNQTTGSRLPTAGKPTSRRKCASFSRSKASLDVPMKSSTPMSRRTIGVAQAKRAPLSAWVLSWLTADARSERGLRRNPVSGMTKMQTRPHRIVNAPPTMTPARSDCVPMPTCSARPDTAPRYPSLRPRKKSVPRFSAPTSSVIHASYAPLVNVYESPHAPQRRITSHGAETSPTAIQAVPIPK